MSAKRVLVVGREASGFLCGLYRGLGEAGTADFDLLELRGVPERNLVAAKSAFSEIHSPDLVRARSKGWLTRFSPSLFLQSVLTDGVSTATRVAGIGKNLTSLFGRFDIVHFQFLTPDCTSLARFVPDGVKKAFTFWGADLFQSNSDFHPTIQLAAMQGADLISVHSPEMRQIFLSKFGRHLEDKVVAELVVPADEPFDEIERVRTAGGRERFRREHEITDEEIAVVIGGSALSSGNHLHIVESLSGLANDAKARARFIFPMTYGAPDSGYIPKVKSLADEIGLRTIFLEEYLPSVDVARMRLAADISIKLPSYDAFSLAMCEDIYAGAIPVTGTWLPYGLLRTSGIHQVEVSERAELGVVLERILTNVADHRRMVEGNAERIRELLSFRGRVAAWDRIYSGLLDMSANAPSRLDGKYTTAG